MGVLRVNVGGTWVDVIGGGGTGGGGDVSHGTATVPVELVAGTDVLGNLTIVKDATPTANWPERLRFNYDDGTRVRRTGYFNEYGEIRSIAAKTNTTAARFYGKEFTADGTRDVTVPVLQVSDDRNLNTNLFAVYGDGDVYVAKDVQIVGNVTAANIGVKVTSGTSPPVAPAVGDVWVDTN
jgi:hypothetical protein